MGKRRAFRGAKKKAGDRYECGKLRPANDRGEAPWTAEAYAKRVALFPDNPTAAQAGQAPAILVALGIISERQAAAAEAYRRVVISYRIAQGIPRGSAKVANIMVLPEGIPDEETIMWARDRDAMTDEEKANADAEFVRRTAEAFRDATEVVKLVRPLIFARGVLDTIAVDDVVPDLWRENRIHPPVRVAMHAVLDRLADHFRIEARSVA